jgi:4'-phosphopantetheinyl transferase
MVQLAVDEVKVWYSTLESLTSDFIASKSSLLSLEERLQWEKFRYDRDRDRYLITRVMTREVLGSYLGIEPQALRFQRSPTGKPELERGLYTRHVEFNITHCEGLVALALAQGSVGIDAEPKNRQIELDVARLVLTSQEQSELQSWPLEHRRYRLLQYWTMKEALVKAMGIGFSKPLDSVSVQFTAESKPQIRFLQEEASESRIWFVFQSADQFADHLFSLALKHPIRSTPRLSFFPWLANQ